MPLPFHQYASSPATADAATIHRRLTTDVHDRVSTAAASALMTIGPLIAGWGLNVSALPTTTARRTGPGELGTAEITWRGDEAATGWPALTGRLVVIPQPRRHSRLLFLSSRSPQAELTTGLVDRAHRQRVVNVSIQAFLRDLARQLDDDTTNAPTIGPGARTFDRSPLFVHQLQDLDVEPDDARAWLLDGLDDLAIRATAAAVARASATLTAGRFRAGARPHIESRPAHPDEPATVWIRWCSDEEATGWPELDLALLVEAHGDHARLAVLSRREPGYDLSLNRIDKHQRHRILQQAGADLAAALADRLPARTTARTTAAGRELVSAPR
jgi:hypothetical protein